MKGIVQSSGRVGHNTAVTDGRRILGRVQTNQVCWRCQLKRRGSVPCPDGVYQLTTIPRGARRKWAAEHQDWMQNGWSQVLFTDELRFNLGWNARCVWVRDEAHFWLNGYVNKQNCRIWSEANPQVYVETPLHPEKLTVWCALWAGGILLQKR
ncbi:hypothetical protein TNCV_1533401 [Trichonephila clavipes]|nr:hypothetical protein TNCV_1533401 [Trichonephila clavipes]